MATWEPQITARAIQPVVAGLAALGHPASAILREAGLTHNALEDVDARFPRAAMRRLWESALAETDDDCLGIHVAEAAWWDAFEVHDSGARKPYAAGGIPTRLPVSTTRARGEPPDSTTGESVLRHALPGGRRPHAIPLSSSRRRGCGSGDAVYTTESHPRQRTPP
jgi:hypothetical protein